MKRSITTLACCFLIVSLGTPLTGCSLIGFGLGSGLDPIRPGGHVQVPEQLNKLEADTHVILTKRDGTSSKGVYLAVTQLDDSADLEQYKKQYEDWRLRRSGSPQSLPPFGSRVKVLKLHDHGRHGLDGSFEGFDPGVIRLYLFELRETIPIRLDRIDVVRDTAGRTVATQQVLLMAERVGVPQASQVSDKHTIKREFYEEEQIPSDQIAWMNFIERGNGRWIGLGIGLVVDVAVVAIAVSNFHIDYNFGR